MSESFLDAARGLGAANASGIDRDLVALLDRHGREEGAILAEYQRLADDSQPAAVRYLVGLIMEDERRHHHVMEEIANAVAWRGFDGTEPPPQVPDLDGLHASAELREQTKKLLDFEERDARELRELRKSLRDFADTTLWALLVDMMILDTEKHVRMLRFILDH